MKYQLMDYKILQEHNSKSLSESVMMHIKDGYELYGEFRLANTGNLGVMYTQAVVKYKEVLTSLGVYTREGDVRQSGTYTTTDGNICINGDLLVTGTITAYTDVVWDSTKGAAA